jgi:hypothetical protein
MAFDSYKHISEVLKEFRITEIEQHYVENLAVTIEPYFQEQLNYNLQEFTLEESEYAVCEGIIFPLLREVYKAYREQFTLWSHKAIHCDEKLSGTPDYILAIRSPLGKRIFEKPFFVAVEAKKDDFIKGWAQCLAEMVAIQKINAIPKQTIFGIVSNGQLWQFGKLQANLLTREAQSYTISDLPRLYGAICYIFDQCRSELETLFHDQTTP